MIIVADETTIMIVEVTAMGAAITTAGVITVNHA